MIYFQHKDNPDVRARLEAYKGDMITYTKYSTSAEFSPIQFTSNVIDFLHKYEPLMKD